MINTLALGYCMAMVFSKKNLSFLGLLTFLFMLSIPAQGQSFTAVKDTAVIEKDLSFGVLHNYLTLTNSGSTDLNISWEYSISGKFPSLWEVNWATPDSAYSNITKGDSDGFVLKGDSTEGLIIGVKHNGETGFAYLEFTVQNIHQPADSLLLVFVVKVTESKISVPEISPVVCVRRVGDLFMFALEGAHLQWSDTLGRVLYSGKDSLLVPEGLTGVLWVVKENFSYGAQWSTAR